MKKSAILLSFSLLILMATGCSSIPGTYTPKGHQYEPLRKDFEVAVFLTEDMNIEYEELGVYQTTHGTLDQRIENAQKIARKQGGNGVMYMDDVEFKDPRTEELSYATRFQILRITDYYGWTTEDAAIKIPQDSERIEPSAEEVAAQAADSDGTEATKSAVEGDGTEPETDDSGVRKNPYK